MNGNRFAQFIGSGNRHPRRGRRLVPRARILRPSEGDEDHGPSVVARSPDRAAVLVGFGEPGGGGEWGGPDAPPQLDIVPPAPVPAFRGRGRPARMPPTEPGGLRAMTGRAALPNWVAKRDGRLEPFEGDK